MKPAPGRSWFSALLSNIKHFLAYTHSVKIIFKHRDLYIFFYSRKSCHDGTITWEFCSLEYEHANFRCRSVGYASTAVGEQPHVHQLCFLHYFTLSLQVYRHGTEYAFLSKF